LIDAASPISSPATIARRPSGSRSHAITPATAGSHCTGSICPCMLDMTMNAGCSTIIAAAMKRARGANPLQPRCHCTSHAMVSVATISGMRMSLSKKPICSATSPMKSSIGK
jgi:hypothetical protein